MSYTSEWCGFKQAGDHLTSSRSVGRCEPPLGVSRKSLFRATRFWSTRSMKSTDRSGRGLPAWRFVETCPGHSRSTDSSRVPGEIEARFDSSDLVAGMNGPLARGTYQRGHAVAGHHLWYNTIAAVAYVIHGDLIAPINDVAANLTPFASAAAAPCLLESWIPATLPVVAVIF